MVWPNVIAHVCPVCLPIFRSCRTSRQGTPLPASPFPCDLVSPETKTIRLPATPIQRRHHPVQLPLQYRKQQKNIGIKSRPSSIPVFIPNPIMILNVSKSINRCRPITHSTLLWQNSKTDNIMPECPAGVKPCRPSKHDSFRL